MLRRIIALIFLFSGFYSYGNYDFNANCRRAYSSILSLKFTEGKALLHREKLLNPQNDLPYYIENYVDFLTVFIGEEKATFEKLKPNKALRIERLENGDKNSPYYRYCLAEVYLQWAFVRIKFGEYLTAGYEINKAYRLLEKNHQQYPGFVPNDVSLGLLHTLIGTIPDNYQWVIKTLSFKGSVSQGTSELTRVLALSEKNPEYTYLKPEAMFFLSFINLNLQNDKSEALKLYRRFNTAENQKTNAPNPWLTYSWPSIARRTGNNGEAIKILLSRPKDSAYYPFYYLEYLTGLAKLNRLEAGAGKHFLNFLLKFKGTNYIKSAYQKLAWSYLIAGDINSYKRNSNSALNYGNTLVDEDKSAEKEARSGEIPNIPLLKSRLLFDGGYYDKALDQLTENRKQMVTKKDVLEYTYRQGRIFHEWGKTKQAIDCYEETLKNGKKDKWYFAANAALQLGLIYEKTGNRTKATEYYNQCLSLNPNEYSNSIHQKAKAGLSRMSK